VLMGKTLSQRALSVPLSTQVYDPGEVSTRWYRHLLDVETIQGLE